MLAVNAWELLLMAHLLSEANGDLRSIQILTPMLSKAGKPTKRLTVERNRAGNPETISLDIRTCTNDNSKSGSYLSFVFLGAHCVFLAIRALPKPAPVLYQAGTYTGQ
jgi:hypothetical protein